MEPPHAHQSRWLASRLTTLDEVMVPTLTRSPRYCKGLWMKEFFYQHMIYCHSRFPLTGVFSSTYQHLSTTWNTHSLSQKYPEDCYATHSRYDTDIVIINTPSLSSERRPLALMPFVMSVLFRRHCNQLSILLRYIGNTIHSQHARLTKAVNIYTQLGASGSFTPQARESSNVPMMHEGAQHHWPHDSAKKG